MSRRPPLKRGESFEDHFWDGFERAVSGCLLWKWSTVGDSGYGKVWRDGRIQTCHRVAWELTFGPIPEGMKILHKCDVPLCANPEHLFLGTQADNVRDMYEKGRENPRCRGVTVCSRGHELNDENTYVAPGGLRQCRPCRRYRERLYSQGGKIRVRLPV